MSQLYRLSCTGILLTSLTGCMTFSGEKLSELEPIKPLISPKIETTVSKDYIYDIDVRQLETNNPPTLLVFLSLLKHSQSLRSLLCAS